MFLIPEEKNDDNPTAFHCFEESPKWHLLSMVLEEIDKDYRDRNRDSGCGQKDDNKSSQSDLEGSGSGQKEDDGSGQSDIGRSGSGQISDSGSGQTSDSGRRQVQEKVLIVTNDYRTSYQLTEVRDREEEKEGREEEEEKEGRKEEEEREKRREREKERERQRRDMVSFTPVCCYNCFLIFSIYKKVVKCYSRVSLINYYYAKLI